MTSVELSLTDETRAALVAGKHVRFGSIESDETHQVCEQVDALGRTLGVPLVLALAGDHSEDVTGYVQGAVGLLVASADSFRPTEIERAAIAETQRRAKDLPWTHIAEALPEAAKRSLSESPIALWLTGSGALASAAVVLGNVYEEGEEGAPAGDPLPYQAMGQEPQEVLIHGVELVGTSYDGSEKVASFDVTVVAEDADQRILLVASYD